MVYDDRATFNTAVAEFVQDGENQRFESDVVFNDDGTILVRMVLTVALTAADSFEKNWRT